ncbi:MAG: orotidine-5'-phosphate decarboxylase [Balneolaceae bacterium]
MEYTDKLLGAVQHNKTVLCVGLDPNPDLIPDSIKEDFPEAERYVEQFCAEIIDATQDYCCAYKPNLAFFEALGPGGLNVYERVTRRIPGDKIIISDAKRGDIGSTAEQYKKAYFDRFDADAVTLNPLMGFETLDPFTGDSSRAIYSLVLTSNPGANDLLLRRFEGRGSLAEYIADQLRRKMELSKTHIGMVVGATYPADIKGVLSAYPTASLLIPGIGSQGGSTADLYSILAGHQGIPVVSSSRSIIYAGSGKNWKKGVAESAGKMNRELEKISRLYI